MKQVIVHEFRMGDVDDPDLYAAHPMYEWEKSEEGQFVMQNSLKTPEWHRLIEPVTSSYVYRITAHFDDKIYTFWRLKYR